MHPLTRKTINEAIKRGIVLDLATHFDAVTALERAALDTVAPGFEDDADVLDRPIVIGEIGNGSRSRPAVLYRPSYAALLWMEEAAEWFANDRKMSLLAGAWALAHSNKPALINDVVRRDIASRVIKTWARSLNCSLAALAAGYNSIMAPLAKPAQDSGDASADGLQERCRIRRVLLRLQAEIGGNETEWLYGSIDRLRAGIALLKEKDDADARALAKAQGKAVARDPASPDVQAFVRWRAAVQVFFKVIGLEDE